MTRRRTATVLTLAGILCGACGAPATSSVDVPALAGQPTVQAAATATPPTADDPARAFNAADIEFLSEMVPHHLLADRIAGLAETRAGSPGVRDLAASLRSELGPETAQMSGWLTSLGVVPDASGGHDHGGVRTTEQDVDDLAALSGPAFDAKFLDLLTDHFLGATTLATTETRQGFNTAVLQFAGALATRQWDELSRIRALG